jgi:16S rRNA (guanine527-N7)-methyltransferase
LGNDFTALILKYTDATGVALSEKQADLCRRHIELMLEWNRRLNLTRITDPDEIVVKHLLDSLLPARLLPQTGSALDIGTGAGFPGVPLKILHPDLDMILLDASRKKVSFLTVLAAKLGLKGIRAIHGRWEKFAESVEPGMRFQLVTMRAVRLEPEHLSKLAPKVLCPGGTFAWWGGPGSEEAAQTLAGREFPGMEVQGGFPYALPGMARERSIWLWKKEE